MAWEIVDVRGVASAAELTQLELEQLRVAGQRFDGEDRAPELRFVLRSSSSSTTPAEEEDPGCFANNGCLSVAKVHINGIHRFDLWCIDPDCAVLFVAGTTDVIAGRCQSTWMTPDLMENYAEAAALDKAMHDASIW